MTVQARTDELIAAWTVWDTAAARIGVRALEAIDRGKRPPRCGSGVLEAETRRLVAAEAALGMPLGWTDRVAALRWPAIGRPLSAPDAVQTVVNEILATQPNTAIG